MLLALLGICIRWGLSGAVELVVETLILIKISNLKKKLFIVQLVRRKK